jgi:hypothetical protein
MQRSRRLGEGLHRAINRQHAKLSQFEIFNGIPELISLRFFRERIFPGET